MGSMCSLLIVFHSDIQQLRPFELHWNTKQEQRPSFPFEGGNVRLVQMAVALQHLSHVIGKVAPGAPLVFCGDFNSSPSSGN